ncbi:hypothetical protein [Burkholderia glumae]|uniref:hypothetical protein n=1 Tax=Burkholderia glumae TaxID=337 RepID=UPI00131FB4EA|nr:hypothetical protein [Burkholderia glumae]QHE13594.1 hypothetical protein GQR88_25615 [Burkholderia glumae AU6208]
MDEFHAGAILDDRLTFTYRRVTRDAAQPSAAAHRTASVGGAPHNALSPVARPSCKRVFAVRRFTSPGPQQARLRPKLLQRARRVDGRIPVKCVPMSRVKNLRLPCCIRASQYRRANDGRRHAHRLGAWFGLLGEQAGIASKRRRRAARRSRQPAALAQIT